MSKNSYIFGKKKIKYMVIFIIPILFIMIHMMITSSYPFGKNSILLGDSNSQYYAFFMELTERIRQGKSLFFSWDKGLGYDFYSNFFYYLASPFNWIAIVIGNNHVELGMIITMCAQVGVCGIAMTYYLAHTSRNTMKPGIINDITCVVFGMAYSMCDYMLAYKYNVVWLACLIIVPFMMLGIEKLVDENKVVLYFVTLTLSFLFNFYFSWFVAMFAVIWFIDCNRLNIKQFFIKGIRFAGMSILSAVCACFVLIPCFLAAYSRNYSGKVDNSVTNSTWGNMANCLQSFFWGNNLDVYGQKLMGRNMYLGVAIIIIAVLYVFNSKIDFCSRMKRFFGIVALIVCSDWVGAIYVLHGFTLPHLFSCRFGFILAILILMSAFECIVNYTKVGYIRLAVVSTILLLAIVYVFAKNTEVQSIWCYMVTIMLGMYVIILLVLSNRKSIKDITVIINIIVITFVELTTNSIYANIGNSVISKEKAGGTAHWENTYDAIDNSGLTRKTSWILSQNDMAYSDTNLFSSSMNSSVLNLFDNVGLVYQENSGSYAYRGATPVTSLMFNVRNVLTDTASYYGGYNLNEEYELVDSTYGINESIGIYDTDFVKGPGFVVDNSICEWNMQDKDVFSTQNDFVKKISGVEGVFTHVDIAELDNFNSNYSVCVPERDYVSKLMNVVSKNVYKYINVSLDPDIHPSIDISFFVPRDMELYMYAEDMNQLCSSIEIDGEDVVSGSVYPAPAETIYLGDLKKGQIVTLRLFNISSQMDKGITYIDFYEYHEDKMQKCMQTLQGKELKLDTVEDTYVKGTVTAIEDGILYTSIPYYRGFTAYVDGQKTDIVQLASGALIGLKLTKGEHTIEFKYVPYGFKIGLLISIVGWLIVAGYIIVTKKRKKAMLE